MFDIIGFIFTGWLWLLAGQDSREASPETNKELCLPGPLVAAIRQPQVEGLELSDERSIGRDSF